MRTLDNNFEWSSNSVLSTHLIKVKEDGVDDVINRTLTSHENKSKPIKKRMWENFEIKKLNEVYQFVMDTNNKLGERINDFSFWKRVTKTLQSEGVQRSQKQIRERWKLWQDPTITDVKKQPLSFEEKEIIEDAYKEHGPKWRLIAQIIAQKSLYNRSSSTIKNYMRFFTKNLKKSDSYFEESLDTPNLDEMGIVSDDKETLQKIFNAKDMDLKRNESLEKSAKLINHYKLNMDHFKLDFESNFFG